MSNDKGKKCKFMCHDREDCDAWEFGSWSRRYWCALWKNTGRGIWVKQPNRLFSGERCKSNTPRIYFT